MIVAKKTPPARPTLINVKGSPAQKAWIERLAKKTRIPLAQITREALDMWAKANSIEPMPSIDDEGGA